MREANFYPNSAWELRDALAAFAGVGQHSVILGNGSTEILDVVTRTFITPGDEAVIPVPTYAFFETQVRLNGGVPVLVPTTADLGFDIPAIRAAVTPRTKLIFLCSPNNPIGRSWTEEEVDGGPRDRHPDGDRPGISRMWLRPVVRAAHQQVSRT